MATVESKVYGHHVKYDGTCNVKIRVFHKKVKKYIETEYYLSKKQLKNHPKAAKEFLIKDPFIIKQLNTTLDNYRIKISELGKKIDLFSCEQLNYP